ncbi:hypothetical protein WA026_007114 [Henosepilachna vigintioctopunctata]|uniref:Uncharacterized protein n=1 Tax=Henosepilachna vigintioctopunctata TaxID=420089 RepID=A0AAW1VAH5_9CUCU
MTYEIHKSLRFDTVSKQQTQKKVQHIRSYLTKSAASHKADEQFRSSSKNVFSNLIRIINQMFSWSWVPTLKLRRVSFSKFRTDNDRRSLHIRRTRGMADMICLQMMRGAYDVAVFGVRNQ